MGDKWVHKLGNSPKLMKGQVNELNKQVDITTDEIMYSKYNLFTSHSPQLDFSMFVVDKKFQIYLKKDGPMKIYFIKEIQSIYLI